MEIQKTINLNPETKARLDKWKIIPEEHYKNLINRILDRLEEYDEHKVIPTKVIEQDTQPSTTSNATVLN